MVEIFSNCIINSMYFTGNTISIIEVKVSLQGHTNDGVIKHTSNVTK